MKCLGCGISFTVEARYAHQPRKYHSLECANFYRNQRPQRAAADARAGKELTAEQVECRRALGLPT